MQGEPSVVWYRPVSQRERGGGVGFKFKRVGRSWRNERKPDWKKI